MFKFISFLSFNYRTSILLSLFIVISSCNALRKMGQNHYSVVPDPLEVHGKKVKVNIKAKFPPKFFEKSVAIEVTPVLTNEKKEEVPFNSVSYQGEEYPGNFKQVPYETGEEINYNSSVDYTPNMKKSDLLLKILGREGDEEKIFDPIKLAPGVITTSLLVEYDFKLILSPDNYKRVTFEKKEAVINFKVNSDYIRRKELKDSDYKEIMKFIKESEGNDKVTITKIIVPGFASPEGEASFNEELSEKRAKAVNKVLKKKKLEVSFDGRGPDWAGLDRLIEESDMKDKDVIKRSLDETPLIETKEKTLRSLANTYSHIKNKVLPALRRAKITVEYELLGKSDDELKELVQNDIEKLNAEEVIFAVNLLSNNDIQKKIDIYKKAAQIFTEDYRFYNNLGVYQIILDEIEAASKSFENAFNIRKNETTRSNLYVSNYRLANGDEAKLKKNIKNLLDNVTQPQPKYNSGILKIKKGEYKEAIKLMAGFNTFNSALVRVLDGDYNGALSVLEKINTMKYSPMCDYLKAIAFVRLGKMEDAKSHIEKAGKGDAYLLDKAKNDLEFRKIYAANKVAK